jgi:benzodiazapine receptor
VNSAGLAISLLLCLGAGALGSLFTVPSIPSWYASLKKPAWTPPTWLFGPVWTILFVMMALAAWLVWLRAGSAGATAALTVFAVQLIFNVAWSWLFFARRNPGAALVDIGLLCLSVGLTAFLFARIELLAAYLLLPYLAWIVFAALLNARIWQLNQRQN